MRTENEIREVWENAVAKGRTSAPYSHVADALAWVLEESDDDPSE